MEALSLAPRRLLLVDPCDHCRHLQPHLEEAGWLVSSQSLDQAQAASFDIGLLRLRTEHLLRPEAVKHLIGRSGTEWIALVDPLAEDLQGLDEFIGECRVKMTGVVVEAIPGKKLVWQLKKGVRLPIRLSLELHDDEAGVLICHTIRVGFDGLGSVLDPAFRLYFSGKFAAAMDEHVKAEFPKLRVMLTRTTGT